MTRKEQNKILNDKIESNINQYKVDRLNAKISAFSSGDLNKYEFLTRKDLKYKPNALDKARFEFSPLGQTFSTGLDKTAQGYQEEGVIKLLKDIRDGLRPPEPDDNNDDNNHDNNHDNDNNNEERVVIKHLLNEINKINNINKQHNGTINNINKKNDDYLKKIKKQNDDIEKLKTEVIDSKKITEDILDEAGKKTNKFYQKKSMCHNELKHELERNLKVIKQRNDILRDIARHTRNDESEKLKLRYRTFNRDTELLNNLNEEHLNKEYKYKKEIKELKDNLSNEKKV